MKNRLKLLKSSRLKFLAAGVALASAIFGGFGAGAINKTEVYANSAQRYWRGSNSFGVVSADGDCPLEVESEKLTFNVDSLPDIYGKNGDYNASVTAEYNFCNHTDMEVTANLIFPYVTATAVDYYGDFKALPKGKILINGKTADVKDRFTYCPSVYEFNLTDLKKVRDFYDESGFFKRGLPVTRYSFTVTELDETGKNSPYAAIKISTLDNKKYALSKSNGYSYNNNMVSLGAFVGLGDTVEVEVYGDGASLNESDWTFYSNGGEKKKINGKMSLKTVEQTTYDDLVFNHYSESSGVSRVDWFNAVTDYMISDYGSNGYVLTEYLGNLNINSTFLNDLMRWYEYDLTVPAYGRVVNSVTAPLLPDLNTAYEPSVYEFTYLSSPAKTWKSFGTLTVEIKTPYFVVWSDEWTKTDGGYTRSYATLPDEEIKFTLSESESPSLKDDYRDGGVFGEIVLMILFFSSVYVLPLMVPVVIVIIVIVVNYKRSRKRKEAAMGGGNAGTNGAANGGNAAGGDTNDCGSKAVADSTDSVKVADSDGLTAGNGSDGADDKPINPSDLPVTAPTDNSQSGGNADESSPAKNEDLFDD